MNNYCHSPLSSPVVCSTSTALGTIVVGWQYLYPQHQAVNNSYSQCWLYKSIMGHEFSSITGARVLPSPPVRAIYKTQYWMEDFCPYKYCILLPSLLTPHHAVHYDLRQYKILSYFYGFLDQKLYRKLLLETLECIYFVGFSTNINGSMIKEAMTSSIQSSSGGNLSSNSQSHWMVKRISAPAEMSEMATSGCGCTMAVLAQVF